VEQTGTGFQRMAAGVEHFFSTQNKKYSEEEFVEVYGREVMGNEQWAMDNMQ